MKANPNRPKGFTLVEMLVVVFVIAILVSIVVGVASSVFARTGKDQTRSSMEVILTAVATYQEITGDFPWEETSFSNRPAHFTPRDWEGYCRAKTLYQQLVAVPESQAKLNALRAETMARISANVVFVDGFGKPMDYFKERGAGGTVLLLSAGADGDYGTQEDNIRSDGR